MRLLTVVALLLGTSSFVACTEGPYPSRSHIPTGQFPPPSDHPFLKIGTDDNFRGLIIENTKPVLVSLYKKGDRLSQAVAKGVEQTALALRPLIDVVVMDGESHGAKDLLGTYGISSLPVILHFNSDLHPIPQAPGQWAKLPEGYQGDGSVGSLTRWSLSKLSYTSIERITDDHTLSYFLGVHDHLGFPKVLLVTNDPSNSTAPLFLSIAQKMRSAAVFGVAHNCKAIIDKYQITEFPTVLGFVPEDSFGDFTLTKMPPFPSLDMASAIANKTAEKKAAKEAASKEPAGGDTTAEETAEEKARKKEEARNARRNERLRKRGVEVPEESAGTASTADTDAPNLLYGDVEYEEAVADYEHFERWVDKIGIPREKRFEYSMLVAEAEEKGREKAKEMSKWASALDPIIVRSSDDWKSNCLKPKSRAVCIAIFRDMEEFKGTNEEVEARLKLPEYVELSRKAAMRSQTPLQIVFVDGTTNHELVKSFGITNGVPDMVSIWPAKGKYYNFLGAINERNILNLFLDRTLKDKNGKKISSEIPSFKKTKWVSEEETAAASASEGEQSGSAGGIGSGVTTTLDNDDEEASEEL